MRFIFFTFDFCREFESIISFNMNQQRKTQLSKQAKSLSARAFLKSARSHRNPNPRRNQTLPIQSLQPPGSSGTLTKRQLQLHSRTTRLLTTNSKFSQYLRPQQQLQEENISLKVKVNELSKALGQQKVRLQVDKKGYSKVFETLQQQFSEDRYLSHFGPNSRLVEGVKRQYFVAKQKYDQKCQEHQRLLKTLQNTAIQQAQQYIQCLEKDNAKLHSKLSFFNSIQQKIKEAYPDGSRPDKRRQNQELLLIFLGAGSDISLLQQRAANAEQKNRYYQSKIKTYKNSIKEKKRRIELLDQLLINKSNEVHHAVAKERQSAKQVRSQAKMIEELRTSIKESDQIHRAEIQQLKQRQRIRFQTERNLFNQCLRVKQSEISKLKQEIYYLSTIISYIKTGQDPLKQAPLSSLSHRNQVRQRSQQFMCNLQKTLVSLDGDHFSTRKRVRTLFQSNINDSQPQKVHGNTETIKQIQIISDSENEAISEVGESFLRETKRQDLQTKIPKKSHIKHSPQCHKVRAIKIGQIQYLKQEIVFRLMHYRLQIQHAKQILSLGEQQQRLLRRSQRRWRQNYISFREISSKLQSYPFDLQLQDANLLSRYIVEDCTKDNIFFHEDNEIERTIAKSILRAFLGEYALPRIPEAPEEIEKVIEKSGKNLKSALSSLAPTGLISATKLCEICSAIQVELSQQAKNYMLSELLSKAKGGLSNLQYGLIFDGFKQIK